MITDQQKVGKKIQYYREKNEISQEQMAVMVGISVAAVSSIERGLNFPSVESLIKIANILNVPSDFILADVINSAYVIKSCKLSDRIEKLPPSDRQRAIVVMETLLDSIDNAD